MPCNCSRTEKIPVCTDKLIIGTIPNTNTEVCVFFRKIGAKHIVKKQTTSDNTGLITLTLDAGDREFFDSGSDFETWVSGLGAPVYERIPLEMESPLGPVSDDCWFLSFENIYDSNGDKVSFAEQKTLPLG